MSRPAGKRKDMAIVAIGSTVVSSLALAAGLLIAPPASAGGSDSSASSAAAKYTVVNGTANAATVHVVLGSTAFPNYTTGAVDNYYSMAHAHVDNSPFAEGTSSPFDTGPLGQTAAAGNFSQPQYADARWPGSQATDNESFGNKGGPYAVAQASEYDATAECQEASSSGGAPSGMQAPKGFNRRLSVALAAWKARWAAPLNLDLKKRLLFSSDKSTTLPIPVPTVTLPTGLGPGTTTSGSSTTSATSTTKTSTSPTTTSPKPSAPPDNAAFEATTSASLTKSGGLATSGESSLGTVSLGGGQIVLKKIDVTASITNTGKPTDTVAVDVGAASIGGVPVTIDQDGVHVQGQDQALPYQQADDALNAALKQAGVQLFTVAPEVVKSDGELTVTATGMHVQFVQPVDAPGVPAQNADHILGEVYVDSLATPAGPIPKLNLSGGSSAPSVGGSSASGGLSSTGGGGSSGLAGGGSSSYSSSSPGGTAGSGGNTVQTTPASLTTVLGKPMWLLVAYLLWQTLAIATGASLWRWRSGGVT